VPALQKLSTRQDFLSERVVAVQLVQEWLALPHLMQAPRGQDKACALCDFGKPPSGQKELFCDEPLCQEAWAAYLGFKLCEIKLLLLLIDKLGKLHLQKLSRHPYVMHTHFHVGLEYHWKVSLAIGVHAQEPEVWH
jgi:hypothetical protein